MDLAVAVSELAGPGCLCLTKTRDGRLQWKVGPVIAQRERVVKCLFGWKEEGHRVVRKNEVLGLGFSYCSILAQPMTAFEKMTIKTGPECRK